MLGFKKDRKSPRTWKVSKMSKMSKILRVSKSGFKDCAGRFLKEQKNIQNFSGNLQVQVWKYKNVQKLSKKSRIILEKEFQGSKGSKCLQSIQKHKTLPKLSIKICESPFDSPLLHSCSFPRNSRDKEKEGELITHGWSVAAR